MFRKNHALAALLATMASLAVAAPAMAWVKPIVSPKRPIVDDSSITVRWKTDRNLKPGQFYEVTIMGARGTNCASFVTAQSRRWPAKGKTMRIRLSSYKDLVNGGPEWCQGKASIDVKVRQGKGGSMIGMGDFRFRAKP